MRRRAAEGLADAGPRAASLSLCASSSSARLDDVRPEVERRRAARLRRSFRSRILADGARRRVAVTTSRARCSALASLFVTSRRRQRARSCPPLRGASATLRAARRQRHLRGRPPCSPSADLSFAADSLAAAVVDVDVHRGELRETAVSLVGAARVAQRVAAREAVGDLLLVEAHRPRRLSSSPLRAVRRHGLFFVAPRSSATRMAAIAAPPRLSPARAAAAAAAIVWSSTRHSRSRSRGEHAVRRAQLVGAARVGLVVRALPPRSSSRSAIVASTAAASRARRAARRAASRRRAPPTPRTFARRRAARRGGAAAPPGRGSGGRGAWCRAAIVSDRGRPRRSVAACTTPLARVSSDARSRRAARATRMAAVGARDNRVKCSTPVGVEREVVARAAAPRSRAAPIMPADSARAREEDGEPRRVYHHRTRLLASSEARVDSAALSAASLRGAQIGRVGAIGASACAYGLIPQCAYDLAAAAYIAFNRGPKAPISLTATTTDDSPRRTGLAASAGWRRAAALRDAPGARRAHADLQAASRGRRPDRPTVRQFYRARCAQSRGRRAPESSTRAPAGTSRSRASRAGCTSAAPRGVAAHARPRDAGSHTPGHATLAQLVSSLAYVPRDVVLERCAIDGQRRLSADRPPARSHALRSAVRSKASSLYRAFVPHQVVADTVQWGFSSSRGQERQRKRPESSGYAVGVASIARGRHGRGRRKRRIHRDQNAVAQVAACDGRAVGNAGAQVDGGAQLLGGGRARCCFAGLSLADACTRVRACAVAGG